MKANELMLGDWVRCTYPNHDTGEPVVRVFQVTQIEAQLGDYFVWSEDGRVCHPEQLQPIPLTPEILEKNGFESVLPKTWEYEDDYGSFTVANRGGDFWWWLYGSLVVKVNAVHELQHALRLCGIEKEIEL